MTVEKTESIRRDLRLAARLRKIGSAVLLLGALGASIVYWRGRGPLDPANDPSLGGFNKANQRQMEIMYGKMGTMTEDLVQHLKRPGTQAAIIAIGSVLVTAGFFILPVSRVIRASRSRKSKLRRSVDPTESESRNFFRKFLEIFWYAHKRGALFENDEREFIYYRNQMSGNPVRIRSGCATVTGYKLPNATELFISREGGNEDKPEVRIPV